jgi:CBS-domain-containing membrane protein
MKVLGGIIAAALLAVFIGPVVVKLNEFALWSVAGIGFVLMLADLVQSRRRRRVRRRAAISGRQAPRAAARVPSDR